MDPKHVLMTLPKGWVTKDEALEITGRSLKRFEQAVAAANLEKQLLNNPGKRPTPIFRTEDIEKLKKGSGNLVATPRPVLPMQPPYLVDQIQKLLAAPPTQSTPTVVIDRMHLITMEQAQKLGYPRALLREWKRSDNPPGIRYGVSGFRFSVKALEEYLTGRLMYPMAGSAAE